MALKTVAAILFFMSILISPAAAIQGLDQRLFDAVWGGKAEAVRVLLKKGANPSAALGPAKQTALMAAASRGNVQVVRMLLAAGSKVNAVDQREVSALMLASLSSSDECVELLIQSGADVNATASSGQSALMLAALAADAKVIRSLLRGKSDVRLEDQDGWTALNWAHLNSDQQVAELVRQAGAKEGKVGFLPQEFIIAVREGDVAAVRHSIESGAPLNATDKAGHTALVSAAEAGRLDIVKLLLSAGADPNITDNMRPGTLSMLVNENVVFPGIDEVIETRREQGITPLAFAARFGHAEVVRILLEAGAKVNAKYGRFTPLLLAVEQKGCAEIVRMLLNAGAEADAQDMRGESPLMNASAHGDVESVGLLLAHGASVQLTDKGGHTALWWGREEKDIVTLLKQAEAQQKK